MDRYKLVYAWLENIFMAGKLRAIVFFSDALDLN